MDPQMLAALGLLQQRQGGGLPGGMPGAPGGMAGALPGGGATPGGLPGASALMPQSPMPAMPSVPMSPGMLGGPQAPNPGPLGGPQIGAARSNPGLMPASVPQTPPQAGTYESGPRMPGDSQNTPTSQEPTGENPQRPRPQNAMGNIPRNRLGALLMPRGGQFPGQGAMPAPSPGGAFNWNNLMTNFLQRQPSVSGLS